ncbi:MAG: hypothetical protein ACKO14_01945 [Armatimonadota bacterium]
MQPCLTSGGVFAPIVDLHRDLHRAALGTPSSAVINRVVTVVWDSVEPVFQVQFKEQPELIQRVHSAFLSEADASLALAAATAGEYRTEYESSIHGYEGVFSEMAQLGLSAESNAWASSGREQLAELSDARRLLEAVIAHPIGARNGFVWFELGWILDALNEPAAKVAECFYHAQRLLRGVETDVLHVARLMMLLFEGGSPQDASIHPGLLRIPGGLALLVCDGSYPEYAGRLVENSRLFEALLVMMAKSGTAIASTTGNAVQAAVLQGLQQQSDWSARLSALLTTCHTANEVLGLSVPVTILDSAKQLRSVSDRFAPQQDASDLDVVITATLNFLAEQVAMTDKELSRLERLVTGAVRERDYWMNSVRSIEAEAKESGFELHAYSITNPFKRKLKERQEQTRLLYEQCKVNLEKQEAVVVTQTQRTVRESQRHVEKKAKLLDLMSLLEGPRLGIAAAEPHSV